VIVVASVSCIYNLGLPERYFESVIKLAVGQPITRGDLIKQLIRVGFVRNNTVVKRGEFRVRGDVLEIIAASEELVYRIELEEQKISNLAILQKTTRTIKEELGDLIIFPPKHFVTALPDRDRAIKEIKEELKERLKYFEKNGLLLEAERLERRTKYDLEMIKTLGYCHGIENYSRHLAGKLSGDPPDTLLEYFPKDKNGKPDFLTIIDESHIAIPQISGMYAGDQARKKILSEHGWRLPSALDNRPLNFKEFQERIGRTIFTSATPGDFEKEKSKQVVEQIVRPTGLIDPPIEVRPVFDKDKNRSQIDDVMAEAINTAKKDERTLIITLTKKMAEELNDFLIEKGFKSNFMHSDTKTMDRTKILSDFRKKKFDILIGVNLLREGLDFPEVSLVAILDADREGFLRSETSLIQTMGRAARNIEGRVILYADTMTGSMKRAMSECERRRVIQLAYNKKHHIIPKSITKEIREFE
jgi:excinuclease ABC subunit B